MNRSIKNQLINNPEYQQAKRLILELIEREKDSLNAPQKADPHKKESYELLILRIKELRGMGLYYPYLGSGRGNGLFVELADGSCKYDLICGIGVHFFGHAHPEIISSCFDAATSDTVMQGNLQQNVDSVELMQQIAKAAKMQHVFLSTSGAMANENALKIIFQKTFPAHRIIAFEGCFAGRTLALSQVTDKPQFREGLPETVAVDYIPFYDPQHPEESTKTCLHVLNEHLKRHPKEYAVLFLELVQGERGFYSGSKAFFQAIINCAKAHGLAVIADEVQTFARTEELFAFHHFELEGIDLVTIGKIAQLGATLWNDEFNPKQGLLSQTFTASTSSIHASQWIFDALMQGNFYGKNGKNAKLHAAFMHRLEKLKPHIQGPFGIGSMIAFTPFNGEKAVAEKCAHKLFDNGVISFIAGSNPTRIRFLLPAGIMNLSDVDPIMDIVEKTIMEMRS